ncbi:MAG: type II toxin-antitoxin system RelE/ParE family toxin [Thermodesulfovibrionia bacterium]|nr:type II toxin-antitoxin system RelE/ParE family toxin [Thermodesulfovibrionia bacterium]
MSYKIVPTDNFSKELKRLSKKYPSLKQNIKDLSNELQKNPCTGTPLGHNCYKIRLATSDKPGGKSGGFRIITYAFCIKEIIFLLSIYDKSETSTINDKEIKRLIKELD